MKIGPLYPLTPPTAAPRVVPTATERVSQMTYSDPFDEVELAIRLGHTTNSDHTTDRSTDTVDGFRD